MTNDKITVSRELLRQVLACMTGLQQHLGHLLCATEAETLRTALEQPVQEPSAVFYRCNHCGHAYEGKPPSSCDCMEGDGFERVEYFTAPQAQPAVEPVAYRYKYLNFLGDEVWGQDRPRNGKVLETQALYTSPPPPADHSCKFPTCQTEAYRQMLSVQVAQDLFGTPSEIDTVKPVSVPLLTDAEIAEAGKLNVEGDRMLPYSFARAIEQAVRQRVGLQ